LRAYAEGGSVDADLDFYGDGGSTGASALADWRAAATGLALADLECPHGKVGFCPQCEPGDE
jgi:hypothetical protein